MTAPWIVVTGLDGSGKTTLVAEIAARLGARSLRLPFHDFVPQCLTLSGGGSPYGDVHTDRLTFALDARLANYTIRDLRNEGVAVVSQRGWMDNFIFGAAQGVAYEKTEALLLTAELERPTAQIYLIADPETAFTRIENSPERGEYETAAFLTVQHAETTRFFNAAQRGAVRLRSFRDIPSILIDTTRKTPEQTFVEAAAFLAGAGVANFTPRQAPTAAENAGRLRLF